MKFVSKYVQKIIKNIIDDMYHESIINVDKIHTKFDVIVGCVYTDINSVSSMLKFIDVFNGDVSMHLSFSGKTKYGTDVTGLHSFQKSSLKEFIEHLKVVNLKLPKNITSIGGIFIHVKHEYKEDEDMAAESNCFYVAQKTFDLITADKVFDSIRANIVENFPEQVI